MITQNIKNIVSYLAHIVGYFGNIKSLLLIIQFCDDFFTRLPCFSNSLSPCVHSNIDLFKEYSAHLPKFKITHKIPIFQF